MKRISIDAGLYQMLVNALKRDAGEGKQSRAEMLEELTKDASKVSSPVVPGELETAYGLDEQSEYAKGWNDCRAVMLKRAK